MNNSQRSKQKQLFSRVEISKEQYKSNRRIRPQMVVNITEADCKKLLNVTRSMDNLIVRAQSKLVERRLNPKNLTDIVSKLSDKLTNMQSSIDAFKRNNTIVSSSEKKINSDYQRKIHDGYQSNDLNGQHQYPPISTVNWQNLIVSCPTTSHAFLIIDMLGELYMDIRWSRSIEKLGFKETQAFERTIHDSIEELRQLISGLAKQYNLESRAERKSYISNRNKEIKDNHKTVRKEHSTANGSGGSKGKKKPAEAPTDKATSSKVAGDAKKTKTDKPAVKKKAARKKSSVKKKAAKPAAAAAAAAAAAN